MLIEKVLERAQAAWPNFFNQKSVDNIKESSHHL